MENREPHDFTDLGNTSTESKKIITIENQNNSSMTRGICHVLMMIGSVITFIRNTVFNIIFILLIIAIWAMVSLADNLSKKSTEFFSGISGSQATLKINPVLYFNLSGPIYEYALPDDDYSKLSRALDAKLNDHQVNDIISIERAFDEAAREDKIKTIYLDLTNLETSISVGERIISCILQLKESAPKTKIIAFAESYSGAAYEIATYCDEIILDPMGDFTFKGISVATLYFKELFDRFRIEPLVFKAGEFKSAVEPFTQNHMSEKVKEEYADIYGKLWVLFKEKLDKRQAASGFLDSIFNEPDNYLKLLDKNRGSDAAILLNAGLVDKLQTRIDLEYEFARTYGFNENILTPNLTSYQDYLNLIDMQQNQKKKAKDSQSSPGAVAVIYGIGEIKDKSDRPTDFTPDNIRSQLEQIVDDASVKAVVFYINSPGGSVSASEEIRNLILKLKDHKKIPVYVSMNSLCASGAYWISTACDKLYASDMSITGSIGVFSLGLSFHELLNEYGVHQDGVESSDLIRPSVALAMPQSQRDMFSLQVDGIYSKFISLVKESRRQLEKKDYKTFAEGRIFTAYDAKELGLIDDIKDLYEVIDLAKLSVDNSDNEFDIYHIAPEIYNKGGLFRSILFTKAFEYLDSDSVRIMMKLFEDKTLLKEKKPIMMAISPVSEISI